MDRRGYRHDMGDPRTPMAWQHRDLNYQHGYTGDNYGRVEMYPDPGRPPPGRVMSRSRSHIPRSQSSSSGSSSELSQSRSRSQSPLPVPGLPPHEAMLAPRGTLRSVHSVPVLALPTWDGEPCPVHHVPVFVQDVYPMSLPTMQRRAMSYHDLRSHMAEPLSLPPPPMYAPLPPPPGGPGPQSLMALPPPPGPLESKAFHDSMLLLPARFSLPPMQPQSLPPPLPPHLLPPMMRPRPVVLPAENGAHPEPLPVRDPAKMKTPTPLPPKDLSEMGDIAQAKTECCRGHTIVLGIILTVIVIGILLAIVLRFTIATT